MNRDTKITTVDERDLADSQNMPSLPPSPIKNRKPPEYTSWEDLTDEEFSGMMDKMEQPVNLQKELAAKIKIFLDGQMKRELMELGKYSESTLRWVREFNEILDKIQKGLYGEKKFNFNIDAKTVSHSDIASKIREYKESHSQIENSSQNDSEKTKNDETEENEGKKLTNKKELAKFMRKKKQFEKNLDDSEIVDIEEQTPKNEKEEVKE